MKLRGRRNRIAAAIAPVVAPTRPDLGSVHGAPEVTLTSFKANLTFNTSSHPGFFSTTSVSGYYTVRATLKSPDAKSYFGGVYAVVTWKSSTLGDAPIVTRVEFMTEGGDADQLDAFGFPLRRADASRATSLYKDGPTSFPMTIEPNAAETIYNASSWLLLDNPNNPYSGRQAFTPNPVVDTSLISHAPQKITFYWHELSAGADVVMASYLLSHG